MWSPVVGVAIIGWNTTRRAIYLGELMTDNGRTNRENGSSRPYAVSVTVDYSVEVQRMTYKVMINGRVVKQVYDAPYSFDELHTVAIEFYFKSIYKGLPNLKVKIEEGEPWQTARPSRTT